MTHSDDTTGLEQRKRKLVERAEPLMGTDDAQRLTTMLRPGAAPKLSNLASRGAPERGSRSLGKADEVSKLTIARRKTSRGPWRRRTIGPKTG